MTWTDLPADVGSYLRNVSVTNVGEQNAVLYYNSVPYIVRAGETVPVPFEAVVIYCGDPRSGSTPFAVMTNGEKTWVPTREQEVTRLRQLYGLHAIGGPSSLMSGVDPETEKLMDFPRLEVHDANHARMYTVLEDPDGTVANGPTTSPHLARVEQEQATLLARMEQQIKMLQEQITRQQSGLAAPEHVSYVPLAEGDLPRDEAPDLATPPLPQRPSENLDWETAQDKPKWPTRS